MKAAAVSSESCGGSSVRTNFYSTYELALQQSVCYLLATRIRKEQQSTVIQAAIRELVLAIIIVRVRTQSHVCEKYNYFLLH